MLTEFW